MPGVRGQTTLVVALFLGSLSVLAFNTFSALELSGRDGTSSMTPKLFGSSGFGKGSDVLAASAEQAEALAKALRAMKGPKGEVLNLEAHYGRLAKS